MHVGKSIWTKSSSCEYCVWIITSTWPKINARGLADFNEKSSFFGLLQLYLQKASCQWQALHTHPFSNKLLWEVKSLLELNFLSLKMFFSSCSFRAPFFFDLIPFSRTFTIFYLFSTSPWFLSAPWNIDSGGQSSLQQNLLSCTQTPSDWGAHAASPHQCSSPLQSQSVPPQSGPWCLSQTCHSCSVQRKTEGKVTEHSWYWSTTHRAVQKGLS